MVAQAIVAFLIAMLIQNGQETAKLKKEMEDKKAREAVAQCQSERVEDCQKQESK